MRPVESFDLGPVGLMIRSVGNGARVVRHQHQERSPYDHRSFFILRLLERRLRRHQGLGRPIFHQLIDLLRTPSASRAGAMAGARARTNLVG